MYNHKLRCLVGKAEVTAGTAVTIAAGDANYRIRESNWKTSNEMEHDKWATGDHAENEAIPGELGAESDCKIKLAQSAAVNTIPDWSPWVEACGMKRTAHGSTGQSWVPHTDNDMKTMTQYGIDTEVGPTPKQRAQIMKGMIGNIKIMSDKRGKPIDMVLNYKGAWMGPDVDIATGSRIITLTPDTSVAERFAGSTVSIFSVSHQAEKFELDVANEISISGDQADATLIGHCWISDRNPRFKIQVAMSPVATFDPSTAWKNGTVGTVVLTISAAFKITIPRGQIIDSQPIDVGNKRFWDLTFKCLRNGSTDATITEQGTVELLYGAKA